MKVHDPDLYEQASAPHASEEAGKSSLESFLKGVEELRTRFGISDFILAAVANIRVESEVQSLVYSLARGDSHVSAELAARLYNHFTLPEIQRAKHLEQLSREPVKKEKE